MTVKFVCGCGKRLQAEDKCSENRAKCPACGAAVMVPSLQRDDGTVKNPSLPSTTQGKESSQTRQEEEILNWIGGPIYSSDGRMDTREAEISSQIQVLQTMQTGENSWSSPTASSVSTVHPSPVQKCTHPTASGQRASSATARGRTPQNDGDMGENGCVCPSCGNQQFPAREKARENGGCC